MNGFRHSIGPVVLYSAPSLDTPFASWVRVGESMGDAQLQLGIEKAHGGHDLLGSTPESGRTYFAGAGTRAQLRILPQTLQTLAASAPEAILSTNELTVGLRTPGHAVAARAWALAPAWESGLWYLNPNTVFLPFSCVTIGALRTYRVPQQSNQEGHEITLEAMTGGGVVCAMGHPWQVGLAAGGVVAALLAQNPIGPLTPGGTFSGQMGSNAFTLNAPVVSVSNNSPKIDGDCLLFEPQRTNQISGEDARRFIGWSTVSGASYTPTQSQPLSAFGRTDATQILTTGGTAVTKIRVQAGGADPSSPEDYAAGLYVFNNSVNPLVIALVGTPSLLQTQTVAPGESRLVQLRGQSDTRPYLEFRTTSAAHNINCFAWGPMLVQGVYAGSFVTAAGAGMASQIADTYSIPLNVPMVGGTFPFAVAMDYVSLGFPNVNSPGPRVNLQNGGFVQFMETGGVSITARFQATGTGSPVTLSSNTFTGSSRKVVFGVRGGKVYHRHTSPQAIVEAPVFNMGEGAVSNLQITGVFMRIRKLLVITGDVDPDTALSYL